MPYRNRPKNFSGECNKIDFMPYNGQKEKTKQKLKGA